MKIKVDTDGIPLICLDEIKISDTKNGVQIDLTKTNITFGSASWAFEYNYKTKQWEEVGK